MQKGKLILYAPCISIIFFWELYVVLISIKPLSWIKANINLNENHFCYFIYWMNIFFILHLLKKLQKIICELSFFGLHQTTLWLPNSTIYFYVNACLTILENISIFHQDLWLSIEKSTYIANLKLKKIVEYENPIFLTNKIQRYYIDCLNKLALFSVKLGSSKVQ